MSAQAIIEIIARVDDAVKNTRTFNDALDTIAERVKTATNALTALVIGKGLLDLSEKIVAVTKAAGQQAEQIEQLSQRTGISTQGMQEWTIALAEAKLGPEDLALGMRTLSQQMQQSVDPTSQASLRFEQLGVVLKGTEAPADVIRVIAERVKLLPDGFEKSAIMTELFGRAGQRLIPLFNGGADAIDRSAETAHRFGAVLRDDAVRALAAADDAFDRNAVALEAFKSHVGAAFAPAVQWFTDLKTQAFILATQGFDLMVDAATKLTARFVGMAQVLAVVGSTIFSLNIFSKEAWSLTLDRIKAIDTETAAIIRAIDADREQARIQAQSVGAITAAAEAARAHAQGQEQLGQKILTANLILNRQQELLLGTKTIARAIDLSGLFGQTITPAMMQQQMDAGDRIFQQSMRTRATAINEFGKDAVETSERLSALFDQAVTPFDVVAQEQAGLQMQGMFAERRRLEDQEAGEAKARADAMMAIQSELYQVEIGFIGAADAARRTAFRKADADFEQQRLAQQRAYESGAISADVYYERLKNLDATFQAQRIAAVRQFPTFWEQQLQAIAGSNAFSVGQIVSTWTSALAQVLVKGGNFKQAWEATQIALAQAALNASAQALAGWALAELRKLALLAASKTAEETALAGVVTAHTAMETAKTAATTIGETTRLGIMAATNKVMLAGVIATLGGIAAVGNAALATMSVIVATTAAIFEAIAAALAASIVGAEMAPAYAAAGALVAGGGGAAVGSGTAALQVAIGSAVVAATSALAVPAFATGGAVFGPTLALVGENASFTNPEYIGHADQLGLNRGGGQQTINVYLDSDVILRAVVRGLPSHLALRGVRAS